MSRRYYMVEEQRRGNSFFTIVASALTAEAAVDLYLEDPDRRRIMDQTAGTRKVSAEAIAQMIANREAER